MHKVLTQNLKYNSHFKIILLGRKKLIEFISCTSEGSFYHVCAGIRKIQNAALLKSIYVQKDVEMQKVFTDSV